MSGQNWRTEVDVTDYLGHQKKRVELEQRRPVIRKASDLVGPGIGANSIQVTDFNDVLATFNGFFSALAGALNTPANDEPFVGTTVSDSALGGRQTVIGLETAFEYTRVFVRNPADPSSLSFGAWSGVERVPASLTASGAYTDTLVPSGGGYTLTPPAITTIGAPESYSRTSTAINVLRPGVYTGFLRLSSFTADALVLTACQVQVPDRSTTKTISISPVNLITPLSVPLTFWTNADLQEIRVLVQHAEGVDKYVTWRDITITRVGDMA